jgi:hypothetical protein
MLAHRPGKGTPMRNLLVDAFENLFLDAGAPAGAYANAFLSYGQV